MRCYICGKTILIKRTIKTLFSFKPVFRCESCKRRYQVFPFKQVIPKENGLFYLYSLFMEDNSLNWQAFNDEVSDWFNEVLKISKKDDYIFWLDKIDFKLLEILDDVGKNIYILTKSSLDI